MTSFLNRQASVVLTRKVDGDDDLRFAPLRHALTATTTATSSEVSFLPLLCKLRILSCDFPQITQIWIWKSFPVLLYLLKHCLSLLGFRNGSRVYNNVRGISVLYIASNGYNLEGRIGFSSFCC